MKNMIKTILIITVVIFGGWELWNMYYEDYNSKQEETNIKNTTKIESQTIQEEGLPTIYIDLDGAEEEYYQNDLEAMIWEVKQQPSYLLKNCSAIYYQSQTRTNEKCNKDTSYTPVNCAHPSTMSIYITLNKEENIIGDDGSKKYSINSSVISHELWHLYDSANGITQRQDFINLYNSAPDSIDEYGSTNIHEFFAQAGQYYLFDSNDPEYLKNLNIDVFNYMEALPKD